MTTIADSLKVLADKGSAGHIAAFLEEQGIQGIRSAPCHCPVAAWLDREGHRSTFFAVRLWVVQHWNGNEHTETEIPPVVTEFIERFDNKFYPALEAS